MTDRVRTGGKSVAAPKSAPKVEKPVPLKEKVYEGIANVADNVSEYAKGKLSKPTSTKKK